MSAHLQTLQLELEHYASHAMILKMRGEDRQYPVEYNRTVDRMQVRERLIAKHLEKQRLRRTRLLDDIERNTVWLVKLRLLDDKSKIWMAQSCLAMAQKAIESVEKELRDSETIHKHLELK